MNFKIDAVEFSKVLGRVRSVVQGKSTMPILLNVLLDARQNVEAKDKSIIRISATDLDISITSEAECRVESPGSVTLPAKSLSELIQTFSAPVELEIVGNQVLVRSGRSRCKILSMPAEEYPSIPAPEKEWMVEVDAETIVDMIRKTAYAVSTDETRYNLNGVFVKVGDGKIHFVATDGHRLALTERKIDLSEVDALKTGIIIPRKGLVEIKKLLTEQGDVPCSIGMDSSTTASTFFVLSASSTLAIRLIDGQFPDYKQVIPNYDDNDMKARLPKDRLRQALKRVMVFSPDKGRGVKFSLSKSNKLDVSSEEPNTGNAVETIDVDFSAGKDLEIGFNGRYILDFLEAIDSEEVSLEFRDDLSPMLVRPVDKDENFMGVAMPMKL